MGETSAKWTAEAEELVARALMSATPPNRHGQLCPVWVKRAAGGGVCDCWIGRKAWMQADLVLTAVADAGLLLPPDIESNRVYGRTWADGLILASGLPDPTHYRLVGPWVPVNDGGGA